MSLWDDALSTLQGGSSSTASSDLLGLGPTKDAVQTAAGAIPGALDTANATLSNAATNLATEEATANQTLADAEVALQQAESNVQTYLLWGAGISAVGLLWAISRRRAAL